jgi:hypothetical protein
MHGLPHNWTMTTSGGTPYSESAFVPLRLHSPRSDNMSNASFLSARAHRPASSRTSRTSDL